MKLKEELRQVEVPHTLSLRNEPVVDTEENKLANSEDTLSPETLSHRLHQGWQQLQEYSETLLNNNNLTCNDNSNSNVVTATVSPYLVDGNFRPMSSDESGSSSEDESSVSYSDTSPLLEVSSYDSDVSLYSDMSEDGSLLENSENNNNDDGGAGNLLEASRMSLSSPSLDESSDCSSISSNKGSPGNKVILPDVLPVGRVSNHDEEDDDDDLMSDASLSDVEIKGRDTGTVTEFHVQKECRDVQVTAEPDIQVDIRMNSVKAPMKDNSLGNKNSYPNGMADGVKRSLQKRNLYTWSVDDKYDVYNTANKTSVRHWDGGKTDSFEKISVVDSLKNLAVKDTVKQKETMLTDIHSEEKQENVKKIQTKAVQANIQKRRKNSVSPLPETVCLFGKENQRYSTTHVGLPTKEECHIHSSKTYSPKSPNHQKRSSASPLLCRKENRDNNSNQCSSNKSSASQTSVSNNSSAANRTAMKKKNHDKAASSPELFEVYTIEAEASHINWVDLRKTDTESEWIRKRRNDREEIRRKLAMDSDTEEFLPEKVNQNSENKQCMRARDNSNLQICFVNEAVTDEDSPKSCDTKVNDSVKACDLLSVPQNVPSQAASSNTSAVKNSSKTQNNNSAPQPSVNRRQRPTFFFNRPRSMILQKTDQKAGVEDLVSRHIKLQAEAREALAQAKEMARMQMEIEKQQKKKSPIAEIVGLPFPDGKTYLNHSTLKDMNVAQLQVIVNDLHSQIESLNEDLVKFLLERDDLHMEQDSMLVDIEDLTRYLGLKGTNCVSHPTHSQTSIKTYNASSEKVLKAEPVVKRSHSVQLRKTKNLM